MGSQHTAVLLCNLPAKTLTKVSVAETLELVPTWLALLDVLVCWKRGRTRRLLNVFTIVGSFSGVCQYSLRASMADTYLLEYLGIE